MTGFLNPKIVGNTHRLFLRILVVYLGHGVFHPVAVLFFSTSVFRIGLKLPKLRKPQKKGVVHLYL